MTLGAAFAAQRGVKTLQQALANARSSFRCSHSDSKIPLEIPEERREVTSLHARRKDVQHFA